MSDLFYIHSSSLIALFLPHHSCVSALSPHSLRTKIQFQGADSQGAHHTIPEISFIPFTKNYVFFFHSGGLKLAFPFSQSCVWSTLTPLSPAQWHFAQQTLTYISISLWLSTTRDSVTAAAVHAPLSAGGLAVLACTLIDFLQLLFIDSSITPNLLPPLSAGSSYENWKFVLWNTCNFILKIIMLQLLFREKEKYCCQIKMIN